MLHVSKILMPWANHKSIIQPKSSVIKINDLFWLMQVMIFRRWCVLAKILMNHLQCHFIPHPSTALCDISFRCQLCINLISVYEWAPSAFSCSRVLDFCFLCFSPLKNYLVNDLNNRWCPEFHHHPRVLCSASICFL